MTIFQASANVCTISSLATNNLAANSTESKEIYLPGTDCVIKSQVSLAGYTSYRVGGPAELCVAPRNLADLQASIKYASINKIPVTILGAGSNLLVSDRGISGLVIVTRHLRHTYFDPETGRLTVAAGEPVPGLAWAAADRGWQGLEWSVGIPGTVGGMVVMNAGAHNSCIADILVSAQILSPDGTLETVSKEQLGYSYRTSLLQGGSRIVTSATFQLQPGADPAQIIASTKQHKQHRLNTQPYHLPSCGSVFRNPKPYAAGWLIEQTGLKGFQIGKAQVAQRHANFIVNCGGASAGDIFNLIHHIQNKVQDRWSVLLEPEVKMLGEFQAA
ncbi:UDP-N-acetylmuramate dehydrogenase [Iningainema tapete]|uniref:UDP-N-acetylenolpyruvoylglucosamine reductase n=1 Tax=Iningainema tapete BLCC-T55 TaxID=2748662 RepID=A0A8J6XXZ8_9CYAN|nr:UDP-N-acetylmuramate dehydrogenase [Iningainema tapete]MBD2778522.1 UDP-N-acetylmuramate dehydrogenase [Iningainema tapete BLCC-T55]